MANKLFLVSATLAFFFLLANASIYRTVVEFDGDDATNPMGPRSPRQRCQKEFQQARHLQACQQWIRMQARKPSYGPSVEDELDLEDDIENPRPQQQRQLLKQCCNELHQEEPVCVCPTLKQAAQAVQGRIQGQQGQQGHQGQQQQVSRIFQTARNLPNICRIQQVDVCPFKAVPWSPSYY